MVTEVLWLIYSLEEKAKAAGGYVHYILGNHEIMNMSNDLRYVQNRYMRACCIDEQRVICNCLDPTQRSVAGWPLKM